MYQPIRDRVAIAPKFESDTYATNSGVKIVRPDTVKRRTTQGIVKYIGPEVNEHISVGDYVFYGAYDGTLFADKGELLIILPADSIKAKLVNIPDTTINNLYVLGKLDRQQNAERLEQLVQEFYKSEMEKKEGGYQGPAISDEFFIYLAERIDAYGRHFEVPLDKAIELITETVKEADWSRGIEVGGAEAGLPEHDPTLYDENKRTCEYCGGAMHLLRDRKTTTVYYKCRECNKIKDRRTVKDVHV